MSGTRCHKLCCQLNINGHNNAPSSWLARALLPLATTWRRSSSSLRHAHVQLAQMSSRSISALFCRKMPRAAIYSSITEIMNPSSTKKSYRVRGWGLIQSVEKAFCMCSSWNKWEWTIMEIDVLDFNTQDFAIHLVAKLMRIESSSYKSKVS